MNISLAEIIQHSVVNSYRILIRGLSKVWLCHRSLTLLFEEIWREIMGDRDEIEDTFSALIEFVT